MNQIIAAVAHHALATPDRLALVGNGITITYRELTEWADSLATELARHGCNRLGVLSDNRPEWAVADLAALKAGVVNIPIPPFFTPAQRQHTLISAGIDTLWSDRELDGVDGITLLTRVNGGYLYRCPVATPPPVAADTVKITFTSGTTGTPKGVCLTAAAQAKTAQELLNRSGVAGLEAGIHLCITPLSTLLENVAGIYGAWLAGGCAIIPGLASVGLLGSSGFDPPRMVQALAATAAQTAIFVPQTLLGVVTVLERSGARLPALRFCAVGGAPVSPALLERAAAVGLPLFQGYGLSESGSVVTLNSIADNRVGSVGRPLPHIEVKIAEDGEILVRGAVVRGYLGGGGPQAGEWWPTGDIGHLDGDGYLYVTGRKKSAYATAFGRNVAPEWVEAELTAQPGILQAALFGEGKPWNVAVLFAPGWSVTMLSALVAEVNRRLPDYAQVGRFITAPAPFTIDNGQITANGRPRRELIAAAYAEEISKCYAELPRI